MPLNSLWSKGKAWDKGATYTGPKPGDFPIGSMESRAAARAIVDWQPGAGLATGHGHVLREPELHRNPDDRDPGHARLAPAVYRLPVGEQDPHCGDRPGNRNHGRGGAGRAPEEVRIRGFRKEAILEQSGAHVRPAYPLRSNTCRNIAVTLIDLKAAELNYNKNMCIGNAENGTQRSCAISRLWLPLGSGFWNTCNKWEKN
jgi:hypothetical protein